MLFRGKKKYPGGLFCMQASAAALLASMAVSTSVYAQEATTKFSIPAQPLTSGLLVLGRQARISIAVSNVLVEGKTGNEVQGNLSVPVALEQMLKGSGLRFVFISDKAVQIVEDGPARQRQGAIPPAQREAAAAAAAADNRFPELSEIVVIGTRIAGAAPVGSKLILMGREEIEQTGRATAADFLKTIPQVQGLGATDALVGARGQGQIANRSNASSVNLRGLGADATLVVVNGRRIAPTAAGAFVDVSQIPLSAVERVEILPDGASALYGSDAVGGVVNFVTRKSGTDSSLRYSSGNGFHSYSASQSLGTEWSSGSALIAYEYYNRTHLSTASRDYYTTDLTRFGGANYGAFEANPGNIVVGNVYYPIPRNQNGKNLRPSDLVPGQPRIQDTHVEADILPSQRRNSLVASVKQDAGSDVHLFADAFYSTRRFNRRNDAQTSTLRVPSTNPFFVSPVAGATSVDVMYFDAYDFKNRTTGHSTNYTLTGGGTVDLPRGWSAELFATTGRDDSVALSYGANGYRRALALADPNPATAFNPFGDGSNTPAATLARIEGTARFHNRFNVNSVNAGTNGALFALPGGDVRMAIGGEYRKQTYLVHGDFDFGPELQSTDERSSRKIAAVYAEFLVPIVGSANSFPGVEQLDLSLAGRSERYSDFGWTNNPKIGVRWKPVESLALRGSWGTSFKAPRLEQLNESSNVWLGADIPNVNAVTGAPSTPTPGRSNVLVYNGNNRNLRPETANIWTVGADFHPASIPNLRAGFTYFSIRYENRINEPTSFELSDVLAGGAISDLVPTRHPTQAQVDAIYATPGFRDDALPANQVEAILRSVLSNYGSVVERGLDFNASYKFATDIGEFGFDGSLTYLTRLTVQRLGSEPARDVLSTIGNANKLRGRGAASWSTGPYQAGISANYVGSYTNTDIPVPAKVRPWTTFDLHFGYADKEARGILNGVSLSLDVENMFDRKPPFVDNFSSKIGYDPELANPLGRVISLTLRKTW